MLSIILNHIIFRMSISQGKLYCFKFRENLLLLKIRGSKGTFGN